MYDYVDMLVMLANGIFLGLALHQFLIAGELKDAEHLNRMKAYEREREFARKQFNQLYSEEVK